MRYKPERKEETYQRIVEKASREFREHGFEGVGIAALMKKLELTHGGFYAHFENKDDLVRKAISFAFDEADETMEQVAREHGILGVIDLYLSAGHVESAGLGCPVPALASEVSRQNHLSTELFSARLQRRIEFLAEDLPGDSTRDRVELATFVFSSMVGAVSAARATSDSTQREWILDSARRQLRKLIE